MKFSWSKIINTTAIKEIVIINCMPVTICLKPNCAFAGLNLEPYELPFSLESRSDVKAIIEGYIIDDIVVRVINTNIEVTICHCNNEAKLNSLPVNSLNRFIRRSTIKSANTSEIIKYVIVSVQN